VSRTCTVCRHDQGHAINVALVQRDPYRHIARRYGVSTRALQRHSRDHIPELLVKAHEAAQVAKANDLLVRVQAMTERLEEWIDRAERSYEYKEVRAFAGEWRQQIELLAKLAGQLQQEGTTNIFLSAEWMQVEAAIVAALQPHPEARESVVSALKGLPNGAG
jgi:hypothetical protein